MGRELIREMIDSQVKSLRENGAGLISKGCRDKARLRNEEAKGEDKEIRRDIG